jgi:uncharacterized protein (TIGR02265 family)
MDTRAALLRRIELSPPEARAHGDNHAWILRDLAHLYGAAVAEQVRGLVPAAGPGSFNYPVPEFLRLLDAAALTAGRHSGEPYGQVLERLGALNIRGFLESPLGRALWMRVPREVHAVLEWSVVSTRSAVSHGHRRYEKIGPREALVLYRDELLGPSWIRGIFVGGLQALRLEPPRIEVESASDEGLVFALRFTW